MQLISANLKKSGRLIPIRRAKVKFDKYSASRYRQRANNHFRCEKRFFTRYIPNRKEDPILLKGNFNTSTPGRPDITRVLHDDSYSEDEDNGNGSTHSADHDNTNNNADDSEAEPQPPHQNPAGEETLHTHPQQPELHASPPNGNNKHHETNNDEKQGDGNQDENNRSQDSGNGQPDSNVPPHNPHDDEPHQHEEDEVPINLGHFDYFPTQEESSHHHNLVPHRERATVYLPSIDRCGILHHIPFSYCCGEDGVPFHEACLIPAYCKVLWAEAFREACNVLVGVCDPTQANIHPEVYYALALERRITLFFIIPLLLLKQSPVKDENRSLSMTIKQRWQVVMGAKHPNMMYIGPGEHFTPTGVILE